MLFALLGALVIGPFLLRFGEDAAETLAAQAVGIVVWQAALLGLVYWLVRRRGSSWRDLGLKLPHQAVQPPEEDSLARGEDLWWASRRPGIGSRLVNALWKPVLLGYLGAYGLVLLYGVAIEQLGLDSLRPSQQLPEEIFNNSLLVLLFGISVVIAAPLAEEIFFRGFLHAGLRRSLPFLPAAAISGFLFSLAHADIGFVLPFLAVGMVLAYVYERAGTLLAPIGVHFLFNAVSFSLMLVFPEARG